MNVVELRKNWKYAEILSEIHSVIPSAIIAGGAVRDLCHDKPVNDIDIYVPTGAALGKTAFDSDEMYESEFWEYLFSMDGTDDYIDSNTGDGSGEGSIHIDTVFEIYSNNTLYNIILVDLNPVEYVERHFDVGLCKAYFDGKKFRLTADFMRDSKNSTLTIVAENMKQNDFDRMMEGHVTKLQRKYPHHSIIIPPAYTEMNMNFIKRKIG